MKESVLRIADMQIDSVTLRFIQPVRGKNVWSDFAKQWKSGIFSMTFDVADLPGKQKQLQDWNMKPVQSGQVDSGEDHVVLDANADYACMIELRTSSEIQERLSKNKASGAEVDRSLRFNQTTPVKEVVASEYRCAVMEKYIPGSVEKIKSNMAIAYRMPLGMTFKLIENGLSDEQIQNLLAELNKEEA